MVESVLVFVAKILFLFLLSSSILLAILLFGAIIACAIGGCTCELCRIIRSKFAHGRS